MLRKFRKKSPWILHYNAGSCNGCDIEILACLAPMYDIERFGILNNGNPKQSDILLVTGPVTFKSRERLVELYSQMAEPKVVVAVGVCTCTGGMFRHLYNCEDGVDRYIPVDVFVPGCAASPEQIIDGVVQGLAALEAKSKEIEEPKRLFGGLAKNPLFTSRREMAKKIHNEKN